MSDPLDALEEEYGDLLVDDPEIDQADEDIDDDDADDAELEDESNPPGFIDNLDDWVAAGKDPDLFKGKTAYKQEYDRIQENKQMKSEIRQMNDTLRSTVNAIAERENKAEARHRLELEAVLEKAKEDDDAAAAIDALEQLNDIKPPQAAAPRTHPVIESFIGNNPVLGTPEIHDEFGRIYNGKLKADGVGKGDQLSDAAIRGYARGAMASVKALYPDRFSSPKNGRQTTARPKSKPAQKVDISSQIKNMRHENLAPQNRGAAGEIYDDLKSKSKKPGDKADLAAQQFAKKMLEE